MQPAIDIDDLARDEAAAGQGEERRDMGDLLGLAEAVNRDRLEQLLALLLGQLLGHHWRPHIGRRDGVDRHPLPAVSRASEKVSPPSAAFDVVYAVPAVSPPLFIASEQILMTRPHRARACPAGTAARDRTRRRD